MGAKASVGRGERIPRSRSLTVTGFCATMIEDRGSHAMANTGNQRDSPPVVKQKTGVAKFFIAVRRLVVALAARRGSLKDKCNASGGAGLIEPAPFQGDPVLAAVNRDRGASR